MHVTYLERIDLNHHKQSHFKNEKKYLVIQLNHKNIEDILDQNQSDLG